MHSFFTFNFAVLHFKTFGRKLHLRLWRVRLSDWLSKNIHPASLLCDIWSVSVQDYRVTSQANDTIYCDVMFWFPRIVPTWPQCINPHIHTEVDGNYFLDVSCFFIRWNTCGTHWWTYKRSISGSLSHHQQQQQQQNTLSPTSIRWVFINSFHPLSSLVCVIKYIFLKLIFSKQMRSETIFNNR